jgi:catechol 2,3-dioxygenase-like lactoylglutathione lyase family enzyme
LRTGNGWTSVAPKPDLSRSLTTKRECETSHSHPGAGGLGKDRVMKPLAASPVRIARPSHDLRAAERFWVGGLGLDVLFRADDSAEGGHALLMVGWTGAAWHLELVGDPEDATPAAPTEEDLLVLYLGGEVDEDLVRRLIAAGGTRVSARNPYWDRWGITIADPDGYRLVLSTLSWP